MPIATRTFRVFVSSTFEDLKEERNALQRDVFPKLRTLCEQHGARFQAIDLRWGVRDEATLDQQTMAICLREIQRCKASGLRPNFIALLGDRYGWQPLPVTIPAAEFDALKQYMPVGGAAEQAGQWYRLDENAVPPEYCLQPRTDEFLDPDVWNPVEQELRKILGTAGRAAGLSEKALLKYEASATHQEILAGLGDSEKDRQHVFCFARRPNADTDPRLAELKSHLHVREFGAGDMRELCELILTQLTKVIEAEVKRFQDQPAVDLEIDAHDRFAEDSTRIFVGRHAALGKISEYIDGPDRRVLVLHGESGAGKSATIAKASREYTGPGRMIRRFIGASPESASGHALLTSLCRQIEPGETPVDYAELESAFRERLSTATREEPLILFIDALDQLAASDPARDMIWLPHELPPNVKVIVSTTDDVAGLIVQLEPMTQLEGGQTLDELLQEAHRTLQPWQRVKVLVHFERCGLPLYLKLAAEESRLWKSYSPPDACTLGDGVPSVLDTLIDRLATNANHGPTLVERSLGYLAGARYGLTEDEVLDVLTGDDAVWGDFDKRKHHEVSERRLPVVVWSRLSLDLEPYLTERAAPGGTVIAFYHRQLAELVALRFLAGSESAARHGELARYFSSRPLSDARCLAELPFQQRKAHRWSEAVALMFNCQFLYAKVLAGMVLDLDADYHSLLRDAPEGQLSVREPLAQIHSAVRLSMHVLAKDPTPFVSQIVGRLLVHQDSPQMARFLSEISAIEPRPWLRPMHSCFDGPGGALLRTLEGHSSTAYGVAVTPDGKRAVSGSTDYTLKVWDLESGRVLRTLYGHSSTTCGVAVTPDGKRVISASGDKTLRVWDLETGTVLRTLEGHSHSVEGVAVTPDGNVAVSASEDKTLKVWDLATYRTMRTLEGHSGAVNGVAVSPDGKCAVSASDDNTLKVWELKSGRALRTLEGHSGPVLSVAVPPDGTYAVSASRDKTLKLWNLETGRVLRTLEGHSNALHSVAVTPDGTCAVSASDDNTLKVWDLNSGRALRTFEGHSNTVYSVAVTPDGTCAISASWDNTLKVWDLSRHKASSTSECHSSWVWRVAVTSDGRRAVSASLDKTLKLLGFEDGPRTPYAGGPFGTGTWRGFDAGRDQGGFRVRRPHVEGVGSGDGPSASHFGRPLALRRRCGSDARRQAGDFLFVQNANSVGLGNGPSVADSRSALNLGQCRGGDPRRAARGFCV